jgi:hypothetical protein
MLFAEGSGMVFKIRQAILRISAYTADTERVIYPAKFNTYCSSRVSFLFV